MRAPRWWDEHVLPRLVDRTMSGPQVEGLRAATCGRDAVRGLVVEVGFGSGRNLAHYGPDVTGVLAVEPADLAWERALPRIAAFGRPVERVGTDAAGLDLSTASVDAVVSTWTLCTIPALTTALAEIARVLRPGGALHFVEHTTSDHPALARAQAVVQPVWGAWAGGCHLDRDIPGELERAAYALTSHGRRGWFVSGSARPMAHSGHSTPTGS